MHRRPQPVNVPAANVPAANVPAANVPAAGVPTANVPAAKVPAANVPAAGVPAANVPAANVPAAKVPATVVPAANVPAANVPAANVPAAKVPAAGIPAATRLSPQHRKSLNKPAHKHLDRQTTRPWTRTNRDERESEPIHRRGRRTKADETRGWGARRTGSWATKLTRNPRVSAEKIPRMHLGMAPPVEHGRISGRPALRSSVHMEHRFLGLDTGDRDVSRTNLNAAHPTKRIPRMDLGLVPPVRQERISGRPVLRNSVYTEHRFPGLDAGDRAGSRMNLDTAQPKKTIPRMDLGLVPPDRQERISGRPVLRNSVHTEHRFPGLDAGNRAGSRINLDTAQLMETEPRMHLGEPLRVNMIRARGGEVEVTDEEPEFGGSRAAPPQGTDCGRPSRSATKGSANDGSDESEAEGRPGMRRRRRRLPEVPCSTASSEERHHGTDSGGRSRARATETYRKSTSTQKSSTLVPEAGYQCRKARSPTLKNRKTKSKTSTLVPEVGYDSSSDPGFEVGYENGCETSRTRASSSVDATDEYCLEMGNEGTCPEIDPADQDP